MYTRSRDSSVGIAMGYADSRQGKDFSLLHSVQTGSGAYPASCFPGPGCGTDNSPPSSAEVKNGGAIHSLSYMFSWHSVSVIKHRDNFTCTFTHKYTTGITAIIAPQFYMVFQSWVLSWGGVLFQVTSPTS
jgi:hypothetical protein